MKLLPVFPAYYNLLDKLGWFALRGAEQLVSQMQQGAPFQAVARQFSAAARCGAVRSRSISSRRSTLLVVSGQ